jgi:hypothetical protein
MAGTCPGGLGAGRSPGVRSPGLRLVAAVVRPGKATQCNRRALLRQGQAPLRSVLRSLDTRALRLAAPRKDGPHKLQRPAASRPGERSACFTPPPLETQRPWGAQPPLRVGCSTQPKEKPRRSRPVLDIPEATPTAPPRGVQERSISRHAPSSIQKTKAARERRTPQRLGPSTIHANGG